MNYDTIFHFILMGCMLITGLFILIAILRSFLGPKTTDRIIADLTAAFNRPDENEVLPWGNCPSPGAFLSLRDASFSNLALTKKSVPCWGTDFFGAGNEIRTRYLHLGKVALCQMSYARM